MRSHVGIEIGEQYIKMTIAALQGARLKLSDAVVITTLSLTDDQITGKFIDAAKAAKVKPSSLTLSLARNLVTVRNLHLPSQDKKEINQMIDLNIARIVPYKREEITFGSRFLGTDEMGYTKVILAIVNSNVLRRQSKILEKAGLFIDKISLSSYGIWEWVVGNHRPEINQTDLYLLLDIDTLFADFIIFSQNNLLFTRSINMGVSSIREAGELGVTKLLGEVKQSLITFYNEEINKKPVAVFLSGAGIKSELSKVVETELGIPARIVADPFSAEMLKAKGRTAQPDVSLTGVAAMALRDTESRVSFMLPEIQIRKALREKTKDLIILGSLFIYFFTMVMAIFLGKIYNQQSYLNKLNGNYAAVEKDMSDLLTKLSKVDVIKKHLALRRVPLIVFSELQKKMPAELIVTGINMDNQNRIIIRGQATQLSDVFKFVGILDKTEYFKDVETRSTRKKKIKEKDVTEFEISFIFAV